MHIQQFIREDTGCCTYVISQESSDQFLVVDPLMDLERFMEPIRSANGKVAAIIDTHIHADHLSGAREMQKLTGASILMHETSPVRFTVEPLGDGERVLADVKLKVIHTPGHTPEHISLLINDRTLVSGDCLLVRDVGRTDLRRGEPNQLYDSLFTKLLALDDRVEIFPAHVGRKHFVSGDTKSTIGAERAANPALQVKSRKEFREYMTEGWPPKPTHYELFVKVNSCELQLSEAQELARVRQGELYTDQL